MLYTGFLGWQWRQTRTLGADISNLRKQLPKVTHDFVGQGLQPLGIPVSNKTNLNISHHKSLSPKEKSEDRNPAGPWGVLIILVLVAP